MSQANLEQFGEAVLKHEPLRKTLLQFTDKMAFLEAVVRLGAEQGCPFTIEEAQAAMRANARAWIERFVC
jgi:hypothetical protein